MKFRLGKKGLIAIVVVVAVLVLSSSSVVVALAANNWSFSNDGSLTTVAAEEQGGVEVLDYTSTKEDITGDKLLLNDPEISEKTWVDCVDYEAKAFFTSEKETDGSYYELYIPEDFSTSLIMAIRDYQLDGVNQNTSVGINWMDLLPMFGMILAGNGGVMASGGIVSGAYGMITESILTVTIAGTMLSSENIINASRYYYTPSFMGIPGDNKWNGISQDGFYTSSSLTISMTKTSSFSVSKTTSTSSKMSIGGEFKSSLEANAFVAKVEQELVSKISSEFSYGINFQQSQQVQQSETVSRTFSARTDEEVNGVGWKLCEYQAKLPMYVKLYNSEGNCEGETYIEYNYLQGVCRVFANGYIEHWNSGELVSYPEFFEGFCTATEVIELGKAKMEQN